MHPMLTIAIRAARNAGDQLLRSADNVGKLQINTRGGGNLISEVEQRIQQEIKQVIGNAYPEHSMTTDSDASEMSNDYIWLIDPLNGINNLMHGFPHYAISIALKVKKKLEVAVVFDPLKDELFTASRGGGAMLNNRRIRVSRETSLNKSLLASGFSWKTKQHMDAYLAMFHLLVSETAGIRQTGSTALDLAYLASGRFDGFWAIRMRECSMASGILLIQEAGGVVTDFSFNDQYLHSGNLIAGSPRMQQVIYQAIEPQVTDELK